MSFKCDINLENYQLRVTEELDLTPFSLARLLKSEEGDLRTDSPGVPTISEKRKWRSVYIISLRLGCSTPGRLQG